MVTVVLASNWCSRSMPNMAWLPGRRFGDAIGVEQQAVAGMQPGALIATVFAGRCCVVCSAGAVNRRARACSDGAGKFGERCGQARGRRGAGSEVVVAKVLHEGVADDDHLRCSIRLQPTHRSQPAFELAVIGLDRIVGVLLNVVPRGRQQLVEHTRVDGAAAVTTSLGGIFRVCSARVKNRRAAAASRWVDTSTSITWPCWSTAR